MAYFSRPDWDYMQIATAITLSDPDPAYDASNLNGVNPAKPAKWTTMSGTALSEFSAKVAPKVLVLAYQYLDPGLEVYIEGNDTSDFSSPAFSQAVTIPNKRKDGPTYQRWTRNAICILDDLPDPDGYMFWRLNIVGTNSQILQIGRMLLLSDLQWVVLFHGVGGDIAEFDEPDNVVDFTERKVRIVTTIGGPQRGVTIAWIGTDLNAGTAPIQEAADFRNLYETTQGTEELFIFIAMLHGTTDLEPWIAYFEQPPARSHLQGGHQVWTATIREASRGVPFP